MRTKKWPLELATWKSLVTLATAVSVDGGTEAQFEGIEEETQRQQLSCKVEGK